VLLADSPGFNDTTRSDTDVLQSIVRPLYELQKRNQPVLGVIYLHKITSPRLAGTALRTLKILQQFCGKENYNRIVFVTTMWQDAKFTTHGEQAAYQRHEELEREFWHDMFAGTGRALCHVRDDQDSAGEILDRFFAEFSKLNKSDRERPLQVFDEMINKGKPVEQTSAYLCAHEEQRLLRQQKEQQLANLQGQRRRLLLLQQSEKRAETNDDLDGMAYGDLEQVLMWGRQSSEEEKQDEKDKGPSIRELFSGVWEKISFSKRQKQGKRVKPTRRELER